MEVVIPSQTLPPGLNEHYTTKNVVNGMPTEIEKTGHLPSLLPHQHELACWMPGRTAMSNPDMFVCEVCGTEKPRRAFDRDINARDGIKPTCIECSPGGVEAFVCDLVGPEEITAEPYDESVSSTVEEIPVRAAAGMPPDQIARRAAAQYFRDNQGRTQVLVRVSY